MKGLIKSIFTLLILTCIGVYCIIAFEKYKVREFSESIDKDPYYIPDSVAGHVHTPDFDYHYYWEEQSEKEIRKHSNNLGLSKNENTEWKKGDSVYRILITGDSHIDGVVSNENSFPNLLEKSIKEKYGKFEVLNAAAGFYSFKNYLGVFRKYKAMQPDLFVVNVYSGNDFIESLLYDENNTDLHNSLRTFWYRIRKGIFQWKTGMASTQSVNQILYFGLYPEKINESLSLSMKQLSVLKKECRNSKTRLLVVVLPTKIESEKDFRSSLMKEAKWTEEQVYLNQRISEQFMETLQKEGIEFIDLYPKMKDSEQRLFWDQDQHLNEEGHAKVANTVFGILKEKEMLK